MDRVDRTWRRCLGIAAGATLALVVSVAAPQDRARAAGRGRLRVLAVNVEGRIDVLLNEPIEIRLNGRVKKRSLTNGSIRILELDAAGEAVGEPRPGTFTRQGRKVRFVPAIPSHLRDPADTEGRFYPPGSPQSDAVANGGFAPGTRYVVQVLGGSDRPVARVAGRRKARTTLEAEFTTTDGAGGTPLYGVDPVDQLGPPRAEFANPPDRVLSVVDQYTRRGGTPDVPTNILASLFGNGVPLDPFSVRGAGNVRFDLIEREGDSALAGPVAGDVICEQDRVNAALHFRPLHPLTDRSTYAFRVTPDVTDLTGTTTYRPRPKRLRLRAIYDFLSIARDVSPGTPPEQLPDPPIDLIFDWPTGPQNDAVRGILKANVLTAGDLHPEEVDPTVQLLFTTRDEPVTAARWTSEFNAEEGIEDAALTTALWDTDIPGAIGARFTAAAGSGRDGDFRPTDDVVISTDGYPGGVIEWDSLHVPAGVTVQFIGTRPAVVRTHEGWIEGLLSLDGAMGQDARPGAPAPLADPRPIPFGAWPGAGGGGGGDAAEAFATLDVEVAGEPGASGTTSAGTPAAPPVSGEPGAGGSTGVGADTRWGGGGGGGGGRLPGSPGGTSDAQSATVADGIGGAGGAGSANPALAPIAGGTGGAAGGNAVSLAAATTRRAGAGGGGGGALALDLQRLVVAPGGRIVARGGAGGSGSAEGGGLASGPGGGGSGGSVRVRAALGFVVAEPLLAYDVSGGPGGTQVGTATPISGGAGGAGSIRLEDPAASGVVPPGGSVGTYAPVGGGPPSHGYSQWIDLGVLDAHVVDAGTRATVGTAPGDAVLVELQFARTDDEDPQVPELSPLLPDQATSDPDRLSAWVPLKVRDLSGVPGGIFGPVAGYDPDTDGVDHDFPIADLVNDRHYRFVRVRVTFQLGPGHTISDPLPFLDRVDVRFDFNR